MSIDNLSDICRQFWMPLFPIFASSGRKGVYTGHAAAQFMETLANQVTIPT
jgi:hypothetical protein